MTTREIIILKLHYLAKSDPSFARVHNKEDHFSMEDEFSGHQQERIVDWNVLQLPKPTIETVNQEWRPELTLRFAKDKKEAEIRESGAKKLREIGPFLAEERETWQFQYQEAVSHRKQPQAATPLLDAIANGRGIPKEQLVQKIEQNVEAFTSLAGTVLGIQQRLLDQVGGMTTVAEVEAIDITAGWPE